MKGYVTKILINNKYAALVNETIDQLNSWFDTLNDDTTGCENLLLEILENKHKEGYVNIGTLRLTRDSMNSNIITLINYSVDGKLV